MIKLGQGSSVAVASALDDEGDLLVEAGWLSKEDAEKLIAHLQKAFEL